MAAKARCIEARWDFFGSFGSVSLWRLEPSPYCQLILG